MAKTQASRPSKHKVLHERHDVSRHADLGGFESAFTQQDYPRALEIAEALVQRSPASPQVHELHANALGRLDRLVEAVEAMQKAVDLLEHPSAGQRLKLAQYQVLAGKASLAVTVLEGVVQEMPEHGMALAWLSRAYHQLGQNSRGLEVNDQAIALDPRHEEALLWRSRILDQLQKHDETLTTLSKLQDVNPRRVGVHNHIASLFTKEGEYDEAEKHYHNEIELDPSNGKVHSNFWMSSHYNPEYDADSLFRMAVEWDDNFAERSSQGRATTTIDSRKRLRIGLLSGGFRMHPVGQMILPALQRLPYDQFELVFYSTNQYIDTLTQKIQVLAHRWKSIEGLSDSQLDQQIRDDEIDILIDLNGAGDGSRYRTLTREPAPLIVKWVGCLVNTTGLDSVDYLLSDHIETPADVDGRYVEKLIRLPDDYICYQVPDYTPDCNGLPALGNGYITFGCLNNPAKLSAPLLKEWAKLLKEVTGSKLLLRGIQFESERFRNKIAAAFSQLGVDEDRLLMEGPAQHQEFMETYQRIDIALDTWPYSGGLTTCEALLMGVPVVTKTGPTFAGRHSATHLVNAGLSELVTDSWEDFRARAKELADDLPNLAYIRAALRTILLDSPVCDGPRFAKHLTTALRAIWQRHCEGKAPEALSFNKSGAAQFADEEAPTKLTLAPSNQGFDWQLESPILSVDNGAVLASRPDARELLGSGQVAMLSFDPAGKLESVDHLAQYGEIQHFPYTALGDGQPATLHVGEGLEPTSLSPLGHEGELEAHAIPTVALDCIEGLPNIDLLALDARHDSVSILRNAAKALRNTLAVQVHVAFQPTLENQPDFSRVHALLKRYGFRFHCFINGHNESRFPDEVAKEKQQASELHSADILFLPSQERAKGLTAGQCKKLAYLSHAILGIKDMAYALLAEVGKDIARTYLEEEGLVNASSKKPGKRAYEFGNVRELMSHLDQIQVPVMIASHGLPGHLVVSLTSYKARFDNLHLTLRSLLLQRSSPDLLILWIAEEEKGDLPDEVWELELYGLSIRFCEDLRSYKKIVPVLREFTDSFIVTADDDLYYEPGWLDGLVASWDGSYKTVVSHRAHKIKLDGKGEPVSYRHWKWQVGNDEVVDGMIFPTCGAGALYPPGVFHDDVIKSSSFMKLCPDADDVWLYWMMSLNGAKAKKSSYKFNLIEWPRQGAEPLWKTNLQGGGNDEKIRKMLNAYGGLWEGVHKQTSSQEFSVSRYWDQRYRMGGTSGAGSYGRLASFKAEVINGFIARNSINNVIEFGCGDGNQIGLIKPVDYLGVDVSPTAVDICKRKYVSDSRKRFLVLDDFVALPETAELVLSLDVIYHLVDDEIYHDYMERLFSSSTRYCVIYSANKEELTSSKHVRKRRFTDWVDAYAHDWKMIKHIPNRYPFSEGSDQNETSFADFYIFEKKRGKVTVSRDGKKSATDLGVVVTGCGRSGTKAMASMLSSSGMKIGHEEIFNWKLSDVPVHELHQHVDNMTIDEVVEGESSWMIVPFIDKLPVETKIVYLLRDPLKVIKSFYDFGAMAEVSYSPSIRLAQSLLPEMTTNDELYNSVAYCLGWNRLAFDMLRGRHGSFIFFDIENGEKDSVEEFLGVDISEIEHANERVEEKRRNIPLEDVKKAIDGNSEFLSEYLRIESIRKSLV
ncbi:tetratricopeptide repeat protein [Halomonas denitrificans]|uniref:O-linked N-acetylglucosamine transferase family protein n=1 Tax=Halomonas denitrificans TaxID=370769 RepID=UPI000D385BD8|nr:tetratricopeptide repeat protein [Halomonas denitrificans]